MSPRDGARGRLYSATVRALVAGVLLVVVSGCPLPTNVVYRCEADLSCQQAGFRCAGDGWCYPEAQVLADGGVKPPSDGGACVPADLAARCAEAECGFVSDGCGEELDCQKRCQAPLECGVHQPNRCAVPSLCTPEGWCWENPLPQGHTLFAALRLDARHQWFVGEARTVLLSDGERSRLLDTPAPANTNLLAIHGTTLQDVFVVGTGGTILHFDGTTWHRESQLTAFTDTLRTVFSLGGGAAIAGGPNGRIMSRIPHSNPMQRWVTETFPSSADVRSVFGDGRGTVYAVTRNNEVYARDAATPNAWARLDTVPLQETLAAATRGDGLLFAGSSGARATLVQRDADAGWRTLTDAGINVNSLVRAPGGFFALGQPAEVMWLDDADAVTRIPLPINQWSAGVGLDGPRVLLGGLSGAMGFVDLQGTFSWASSERPTAGHALNAVCGTSPSQLYAVGGIDQGAACNNCNVKWLQREETPVGPLWTPREFQLGSTTRLLACYAETADRVWFPGNDSKFVFLNAGTPEYGDFTGGFAGVYRGGWGTPEAGYYFARSHQELTYSADGRFNFALEGNQSPAPIESVWGLDKDDIVAVGVDGTVSAWLGSGWVSAQLGAGAFDFKAVHGVRLASGERRYVAVGDLGTVLSVVGDAGTLSQASAGATFNATWVSPGGTAWSAGRAPDGGAYVARTELDGTTTSAGPSSPRATQGVFGLALPDGGQSVWVTGAGGLILRRDGP